jgi:tetratricopeptide (TPR) repeat protein
MAKKRVSRSRKRDLAEPDEFITFWTRLINFISEYRVQFSFTLGMLLLMAAVAVGIHYFSIKAESNAFALLDQGIAKYEAALKSNGPEQAYTAVEKDFQFILEKYSSRDGGNIARVVFANICYNAGAYDAAIRLYNKSLQHFDNNPFYKYLLFNNLAYSHEEKKDFQTAVQYFEKIASQPDYSFKDEALFNIGGIYAALGESGKSIEAFKRIISDHKDSIYSDVVKEKVTVEAHNSSLTS